MTPAPVVRDVLLVGGGHSHALVLRRFGMRPEPGVRLTLVSDGVLTPYSGMLPGLLAGHYRHDDVHIDLRRLCDWAGVRFIDARLSALDPDARLAQVDGRPPIAFDLASLDTGSTPDLSVPGARDHATPVKPVHELARRWSAVRSRVDNQPASSPLRIAVVGSGAGGFEILMAVRHALSAADVRVHWILRDELPLSGRHASAQRAARRAALDAGVEIHTGFDVARVLDGPVLQAADGRTVSVDELLWCTGASGPAWPKAAGLATDERGFVLTDPTLRSISHPWVFATGDIGSRHDEPHAKAGVHAVRQAPVLDHNLRAAVSGQRLRAYRPQRDFLSLMATGAKHAIASRGPVTVSGAWVWHWKDRIDRRFMQRFERLPPMSTRSTTHVLPDVLARAWADEQVSTVGGDVAEGPGLAGTIDARTAGAHHSSWRPAGPRCRGCGAKVGGDLLAEALARQAGRPGMSADDVSLGVAAASDVSMIAVESGTLVQSVDQLGALFDDPWRFARIATLHALADVLTRDATPHSALLTLVLPSAAPRVQRRELDAVLNGVIHTLAEHDMTLLGGHTAEGPELQIGLTINAFSRSPMADEHPPAAGDALLLTRPVGSGMLFAGAMRHRARGVDLEAAIARMARSQRAVARCLREHGSVSMTDVTGFGLAGHLERLLAGTGHAARWSADAVPVLAGAMALSRQGVASSLAPANAGALLRMRGVHALPSAERRLLTDPQTAGGLLAIVPAARAVACLAALRVAALAPEAARLGVLVEGHIHQVSWFDDPPHDAEVA